jgi:ribosome-associated protein
LKPGFSSQDKVREGLMAALDRKAAAVLVFNLTELTTMADYFVLSTARSDRQARAIADAIAEKLGPAHSVEGMSVANWILMDYGDVVFHVFQEEARKFYALERLWGDAPNETGFFQSKGV